MATGDGCKSLSEWVASRLDVSTDTARSLVRTMRRTQDRPDLREALETGVSFDRIEAVSRIPDRIGLLEHLDVAGVEREAALHTRITAGDEQRSSEDQFLILQPSLDQSWWKLWGGLDGSTGTHRRPDSHRDRRPATCRSGNTTRSRVETRHGTGPDLYQRHTSPSPGDRPCRRQTCSPKQRTSRCGLGSRTPGMTTSPRSGPL